MLNDSAGRVPFFVHDGKIVFGLAATRNRFIDKEFIRSNCGEAVARLVPEEVIVYGVSKGHIEPGESPGTAAGRESAEEIGYNATGKTVKDEKGKEIPPHPGKITEYLTKTIDMRQAARGDYTLTLFVDRIEPYSFVPKDMEEKTEDRVSGRMGNIYKEGGKWGSIADIEGSLELFKTLSKHREVMANTAIYDRIHSHITSVESQITAMKEIESELIRKLKEQGETVSPSSGRNIA